MAEAGGVTGPVTPRWQRCGEMSDCSWPRDWNARFANLYLIRTEEARLLRPRGSRLLVTSPAGHSSAHLADTDVRALVSKRLHVSD